MSLKVKAPMISILIFFLFCGLAQTALAMGKTVEVPRVTAEELRSMMGNPDVMIIDVRESSDWKESKLKIQGAIREDPEKDVETWAEKIPKDKTLVLYCS